MCTCCGGLEGRIAAFKEWKEMMDAIDPQWLASDAQLKQEAKAYLVACMVPPIITVAQVVRAMGYNRHMKRGELPTICLQVAQAYHEVHGTAAGCYTEDDRELMEVAIRKYFGY